jgi:hypothetical protein
VDTSCEGGPGTVRHVSFLKRRGRSFADTAFSLQILLAGYNVMEAPAPASSVYLAIAPP